jgi:hypothetical protein
VLELSTYLFLSRIQKAAPEPTIIPSQPTSALFSTGKDGRFEPGSTRTLTNEEMLAISSAIQNDGFELEKPGPDVVFSGHHPWPSGRVNSQEKKRQIDAALKLYTSFHTGYGWQRRHRVLFITLVKELGELTPSIKSVSNHTLWKHRKRDWSVMRVWLLWIIFGDKSMQRS